MDIYSEKCGLGKKSREIYQLISKTVDKAGFGDILLFGFRAMQYGILSHLLLQIYLVLNNKVIY